MHNVTVIGAEVVRLFGLVARIHWLQIMKGSRAVISVLVDISRLIDAWTSHALHIAEGTRTV